MRLPVGWGFFAALLCFAACSESGSAPPGAAIDGGGGSGAEDGGSADAIDRDAHPIDDAYVPRCTPSCFRAHEICVDPDGPGGADPFCGCADDDACQGTGTCDQAMGICLCGAAPACAPPNVCVGANCEGPDGGN